mmetsp:Transcript_63629/g.197465  ORF Transcript_63629/g.197465 Transcript_63629/m.197465 type:complete len:349 (+) Transcript_63629:1232-2278(+)
MRGRVLDAQSNDHRVEEDHDGARGVEERVLHDPPQRPLRPRLRAAGGRRQGLLAVVRQHARLQAVPQAPLRRPREVLRGVHDAPRLLLLLRLGQLRGLRVRRGGGGVGTALLERRGLAEAHAHALLPADGAVLGAHAPQGRGVLGAGAERRAAVALLRAGVRERRGLLPVGRRVGESLLPVGLREAQDLVGHLRGHLPHEPAPAVGVQAPLLRLLQLLHLLQRLHLAVHPPLDGPHQGRLRLPDLPVLRAQAADGAVQVLARVRSQALCGGHRRGRARGRCGRGGAGLPDGGGRRCLWLRPIATRGAPVRGRPGQAGVRGPSPRRPCGYRWPRRNAPQGGCRWRRCGH